MAERVDDEGVMRLLKLILKASGKRGVPQGGVISPLLANVYLHEVDKMLEWAKEVTRRGLETWRGGNLVTLATERASNREYKPPPKPARQSSTLLLERAQET